MLNTARITGKSTLSSHDVGNGGIANLPSIFLGTGVGNLLFGFTEAKVRELLGLEDKLYVM